MPASNPQSPAPEFETDEDRLTFLVRFPLHPDAPKGYGLGLEPESGLESELELQPESILRGRILAIVGERPFSKREISTQLGQKAISGQLNLLIRQLVAEGLIEMTIPEKPNSRLQKYRLATPKSEG